ncbi:MAG: HAD family hydrolase [Congregibacter sp.]
MRFVICCSVCIALVAPATPGNAEHHRNLLSSWNDSDSRQALINFVERVTDEEATDYLAPEKRIAVFDNDGTLWAEQPAYFQLLFALDRARDMIKREPSLAEQSPFREVASGDMQSVIADGEKTLLPLVMKTHAGMSEAQFAHEVADWMSTARHPRTQRPYTEMVYQPMLELLDYLRDNDFSVWIVSGGGVSFMRVWAQEIYGVPPHQVIGSRMGLSYEGGGIQRTATYTHVNDKAGKPVGIQQQIGRRPILAGGNSDGDFAMLEWTTSGPGPSLGLLIHHTDEIREWAYDRESHIGKLDQGLNEAPQRGWVVIDMQNDWANVFPTAAADPSQ